MLSKAIKRGQWRDENGLHVIYYLQNVFLVFLFCFLLFSVCSERDLCIISAAYVLVSGRKAYWRQSAHSNDERMTCMPSLWQPWANMQIHAAVSCLSLGCLKEDRGQNWTELMHIQGCYGTVYACVCVCVPRSLSPHYILIDTQRTDK